MLPVLRFCGWNVVSSLWALTSGHEVLVDGSPDNILRRRCGELQPIFQVLKWKLSEIKCLPQGILQVSRKARK